MNNTEIFKVNNIRDEDITEKLKKRIAKLIVPYNGYISEYSKNRFAVRKDIFVAQAPFSSGFLITVKNMDEYIEVKVKYTPSTVDGLFILVLAAVLDIHFTSFFISSEMPKFFLLWTFPIIVWGCIGIRKLWFPLVKYRGKKYAQFEEIHECIVNVPISSAE